MTQQDYEELKAEVKKTMMAELFKTKKNLVNYERDIYDYAFDRAYALGTENFQQDSDANWEKNMTQTLKTLEEAEKALGISEDDITDAADWIQHVSEDAAQGIIKLETISKVLMLTKLYSDVSDKDTTCTPAEDVPSPMYQVPSTKSDVPSSEPTANYLHVAGGLNTAASTQDFDNIVKNSFRNHNRLHIAAMAMQGMLSNTTRFSSYEISDLVRISLNCADALIAKCEKGNVD